MKPNELARQLVNNELERQLDVIAIGIGKEKGLFEVYDKHLAEAIGVSISSVGKYYAGRMPREKVQLRISELYRKYTEGK